MAKQLTTASIATGQTIEAGHVTQSAVAFTGGEAYDITISGSLTVTGSTDINGVLSIPGFPDVSSSLADSGGGVGFPFTGSAEITGSLEVTGSTNILASEGSNLTLEINESASFEFLTGAPNTGSFIVQTSPDTGRGELQVFAGQGTGTVFGQPLPNHIFGVKYTTGSNASEGELTMTVGKRDLSGLSSIDMNNFYVSYEPSGIFTNAQGELEFFVGEHPNVSSGIILQYRGGASGATQTSSFAGYFSSSAFPGQQQYTRPFVLSNSLGVPLSDSNPAFVINKNITDLTTSNFSVDYGGNVAASGNISASGNFIGNQITGSKLAITNGGSIPQPTGYTGLSTIINGGAFFNIVDETEKTFGIFSVPNGNDILRLDTDNLRFLIDPANDGFNFGIGTSTPPEKLTVEGNISASGDLVATNITASAIGNGDGGTITVGGPNNFITIEDGGDQIIDFRGGETNFKYDTLFFKDAQDGATIYLQGSNGADNVRMQFGDPEFESTGFQLDLNIGNASAHFSGLDVTGSKHGLFQAGKPIVTHTSSPISSSLANAGKYHIVSGDLTASIVINSSTPVGAEYEFFQSSSAGQFLFESASGTTVISKNGSMRLAQQGSSAVLKKVSTTTFHLMGDLT